MNRHLSTLIAALAVTVVMSLADSSKAQAQANWIDCSLTEVGRSMAESGWGARVSISCSNVWTTDSGQAISSYSLPVNHPDANHYLQLATAAFLSGRKLRVLAAQVEPRDASDPALQGCDPNICRVPLFFTLVP
jgi:hypothetical protein